MYDVIIIGGGPIGLACALEAIKYNLKYIILEKGTLVNSLYHYPVNMTFFSTSERLEIGEVPFVSNNAKPTRSEALEYYRRVTADKHIAINLFEEVTAIHKMENIFTLTTNKNTYTTVNVIISTGFYDIPYLLNIEGEHLPKVKHYYNDPAYYAFQKVLVIGAANSAIDAALETYRKGAEVTMVIRDSAISNRVKYWVKPDIENRIAEGNIKAYFSSSVKAIRNTEVSVQTPDGVINIKNDWVLALTGYQPDLDFLIAAGIHLDNDATRKPKYNEETMETNVSGLYLAGVICGGMNTHRLFIENSREHAVKIINHICRKNNTNTPD